MWNDFLNMIFPECCLTCGRALAKYERLLCVHCLCELPYTNYHLDNNNPVACKFHGRIRLEHAFAYLRFVKQGKVQSLLHHLKYKGYDKLGEMLGQNYGLDLQKAGLHRCFDLVLPVPLHQSRLRQRGYNQSEGFARGLALAMGIGFDNKLLSRSKANTSQTRLHRVQRWENVQGIFCVSNPGQVAGKNILLADDVITTGATLEACASALLEAGCRSLGVACIASA